jgi:secreted trypsin-like serine protease
MPFLRKIAARRRCWRTKATLFIILSALASCEVLAGNTTPLAVNAKIIGGSNAPSSSWPWIAALIYKSEDMVFCGGSLIAKNWVLTAAHCVYNKTAGDLEVLINRTQLQSTQGEKIAIKQIVLHPLFIRQTLQNDIALLKLATAAQAEPIETLSDFSRQDEAGQTAIALGWGNSSVSTIIKVFPDNLQQVKLPIVSNALCKERMRGIEESMLCAGFIEGGKDTCEGDSGGPLIVFDSERRIWRQAGITSFGQATCATKNFYGVYTRLKLFKAFISETICSAEQRPPPPLLNITVNNTRATATWSTSALATGYRLIYAPYPAGVPVYSLEPTQRNQFSLLLPKGSGFIVKISAYQGNCRSEFSNSVHFVIR